MLISNLGVSRKVQGPSSGSSTVGNTPGQFFTQANPVNTATILKPEQKGAAGNLNLGRTGSS